LPSLRLQKISSRNQEKLWRGMVSKQRWPS
jgi:hypothetical protein